MSKGFPFEEDPFCSWIILVLVQSANLPENPAPEHSFYFKSSHVQESTFHTPKSSLWLPKLFSFSYSQCHVLDGSRQQDINLKLLF